jgi:serine/threonine protein kinase
MKYLMFGSLFSRLEAGLAKCRQSPPILRCSRLDWIDHEKMFIGVDDWELKLHLALGIARGIRAMHSECVWHRDLKSLNVLINSYHPIHVHIPPSSSSNPFETVQQTAHNFLLQISSHHLTQDVLAIAAAREVKAYPFDMMPDDDSPQISSSFPIATPRTPHSPIRAKCLCISISDQCIDHADSLYTYFMDKQLESTHACIAAACVYLAVQANQAGSSCSIDSISQAFDCSVDDITRLKSKLSNSFSNTFPDDHVEIPVFYASVCDFGLSKVCISCQSIIIRGSKTFFPQPSGDSDSADNDEKGSLPYMAPEIFEKRYKSSIFQARTPKTPVTSHARTP